MIADAVFVQVSFAVVVGAIDVQVSIDVVDIGCNNLRLKFKTVVGIHPSFDLASILKCGDVTVSLYTIMFYLCYNIVKVIPRCFLHKHFSLVQILLVFVTSTVILNQWHSVIIR